MKVMPLLREVRWQVVAFLTVSVTLNYADRAAMSAVLPALRADFRLSDVELGMLGSLFLWSYALASPLAGALADRFSRRALVLLSLLLWSIVTVLTGVSNGLMALLALRCCLGVTESLYLPAAIGLLAQHHGTATRGRAMGLHSVGLNLGPVLGGACAGYLAEAFRWQVGFWVLGLCGIALSMLGSQWLREGPTATAARRSPARLRDALGYLLRVPSFHVLLAKAMLAGVGVWIFLNWLPLYFRDAFAMNMGAAGFAGMFMLQISSVLGIALGGWISDRAATRDARRRMLVQAVSYFAAAPFLMLFLLRPGFALVTVSVSLFSLLRGIGNANENPTLCDVVPESFRSTAVGIMNTCATAAGGVGVLLTGVLKAELGLNGVFASISLLFVVAGTALLLAYWLVMPRDVARASAFALARCESP
jgi:sugar phosphate permease